MPHSYAPKCLLQNGAKKLKRLRPPLQRQKNQRASRPQTRKNAREERVSQLGWLNSEVCRWVWAGCLRRGERVWNLSAGRVASRVGERVSIRLVIGRASIGRVSIWDSRGALRLNLNLCLSPYLESISRNVSVKIRLGL